MSNRGRKLEDTNIFSLDAKFEEEEEDREQDCLLSISSPDSPRLNHRNNRESKVSKVADNSNYYLPPKPSPSQISQQNNRKPEPKHKPQTFTSPAFSSKFTSPSSTNYYPFSTSTPNISSSSNHC